MFGNENDPEYKAALERHRSDSEAELAAYRLLRSKGYVVTYNHDDHSEFLLNCLPEYFNALYEAAQTSERVDRFDSTPETAEKFKELRGKQRDANVALIEFILAHGPTVLRNLKDYAS